MRGATPLCMLQEKKSIDKIVPPHTKHSWGDDAFMHLQAFFALLTVENRDGGSRKSMHEWDPHIHKLTHIYTEWLTLTIFMRRGWQKQRTEMETEKSFTLYSAECSFSWAEKSPCKACWTFESVGRTRWWRRDELRRNARDLGTQPWAGPPRDKQMNP